MESRDGAAVEIRGLRAGYGPVEVLRGVDLDLPSGGRLTLLGPNGAGKTTLFRCVLGLLAPRAGTIAVDGLPPPRLRALGGTRVAAVLEGVAFPPRLSALEWLEHHARLAGIRDPLITAGELLRAWDVPSGGSCERSSQGERRKLAVLRALLSSPGLLLLDEPVANLDPVARDDFWSLLDAWAGARGASVLVTSHQLEEVVSRRGECAVLGRGSVLHRGPAGSFASAFPASRLLRLDRPSPGRELSEAVGSLGGWVSDPDPSDPRERRVRLPGGPADHPALLRALAERGVGVEQLADDATTLREAYRACLGDPAAREGGAEVPPPPVRIPSSSRDQVAAWGRFQLRSLLRDRRLLVPQAVLLLLLCGSILLVPASFAPDLAAGFAALGALLPTGLCAALAADLVAGERDRRTLEDSLALPGSFDRALAGSLLAVLLYGSALSLAATAAVGWSLARSGSPVGFPTLASIALVFGPAAHACCCSLGLLVSLRARTARAAAQLSTLASLPLLVAAQALPRVVPGSVEPWIGGAASLLVAAALLLAWTRPRISPERLLR